MYTHLHTDTHTLELPFSDALAWRSQGQGGGNVCKSERDTHTVFVPLRRRSCHVSLWQMTPVGKKSARRFCFRFRPAASLLLLLFSNRVAFNGTVARSAACGIFIHRNKRRTHVTDQAANSQKKHRVPLIRKHIQSEVSVHLRKRVQNAHTNKKT